MARLHLRYKEEAFDPRLLELTKRFIVLKPWQMENPQQMFETWVHGANLVFNLPNLVAVEKAKVGFQQSRTGPTYGEYHAAPSEDDWSVIVLRKWSVLSLLHQYRHHMQEHSDDLGVVYKNDHEKGTDAQAWACSLFYRVAPRRFRRMVRAGRVQGVYPEDLLKRKKK